MLPSNYIIFLIFLIYIHSTSTILVVPYITKRVGLHEYIEYNKQTYTTTTDLIRKILKDRRIKNLREVFLYNAGVKIGDLIIPSNLRYCESMMPYIDARYVSVEIDVTSSTRLHQKVYYCKGHNFYSFEEVLTYSLKYRCHISFQTTIQLVTRKPDVIKPTPAPKTFYVHTPFGPVYYRRNFPTYHIWKETWLNCGTKCCTFHKSYKFSELKKKYYTEINRYRRFVYLSPLIVHPKLTRLAQNRASYMAQHFVLQSDENQRYDEVIGKVRSTILINFIRILFNDAWFHNPYFSRISATRRDFARIMSQNQKFIGVGMAERFGHVFICIKFTPKSWSEIK